MIEPCATVNNASKNKVLDFFHLLSCGHVVAVDELDRRCGRNCQHAAAHAASCSLLDNNSLLQEDSHAPFLSPAGAADDLNCIVCNGIPFDRYRLMTTTEKPCTPRRTLALTRHLLQSTLETKDGRIDAILCSPFFHSNQEGFDLGNTHYLRCGHDVWSAQIRPCASNCSLYPGCGNAVCRECVSRADLVFQRYTDLEQVTRAGVESGYVIAGSQFTPEAKDEYTDIETSDTYAHM